MTQDYRPTLFLPNTEFPMRGNLPQKEPKILERWEKMGLYEKTLKAAEGRPVFTLHDGPPYANGNLHLGHALNKILKDIINRSQFKMGRKVAYVPGWDCHGLPIETKVEEGYRKKGRDKDSVPRIEFRRECREFAQKWLDIQCEEFKRLGVMGDWEDYYSTMSHDAEAEIVRLLGEFLLSGNLYRGVKPVMWSVVEKTALAEAEVEYKDHESPSIYVRFPVVKAAVPELDGASAVIWTTTPWTIPANRAIAYGEDVDYVILQVNAVGEGAEIKIGDKILVAQLLADNIKEATGITEASVVRSLKGAELKGTVCHHPLNGQGYDFDVPLLPGEHVTTETGTGLVHTAPSHGVEDFQLGKEFGLEVPELISDGGVFNDNVPLFAGQHVYKVNPSVCEKLRDVGALLHESKLLHSYPHSWRSKKPLIYRATPQWFIGMTINNLQSKALDAIESVQWFPGQSINRIKSMVEGRPDWCVSRQREWGVPITVFVHKETGEALRDPEVMERIVEAVKRESTDVWYTADPQEFLGDKYNADDYEQVQDILDVWFDSGCTHSFVLRNREGMEWPADLYLEGSDQHRGWFQSSLLVSCAVFDAPPYRQVLTHGMVLDENGYKMSKSQGNIDPPAEIANKVGIDILRLLFVGADATQDMCVGPQLLQKQQDIYRRYRNTLRYLLGALDGYEDSEAVNYDEMPDLEKWVLYRLRELDLKVRRANQDYGYQDLYMEIHNFCSVDLSAFYFDIRKDSLYCDAKTDPVRRATRTVMNHVFDCLVRWLAPVLCFTAEEAWLTRHPSEDGSIHLELFADTPDTWENSDLAERFKTIRAVRSVVTGAIELERAEKRIGSSLQAAVDVYLSEDYAPAIEGILLDEYCITSAANVIVGDVPEGAFQIEGTPAVGVVVKEAQGNKCARCWKILDEVGSSTEHPELCMRCENAVEVSNAA